MEARHLAAATALVALVAAPIRAADGHAGAAWLRVDFNPAILGDLGVGLFAADGAVAAHHTQSWAGGSGGGLAFRMDGGGVAWEPAGRLVVGGDLRLAAPEWVVDLSNLELRPAAEGHFLEARDPAGTVWLHLDLPHPDLDRAAATLTLRHLDVSVAPALAERLDRPDLVDLFLGAAEIEFALTAVPAPSEGLDPSCDPAGEDIDVVLTAIGAVSQLAREADVRVALAPSATLENGGTEPIPWGMPIAPDDVPGDIGPHPYLAMNFYRLDNGRFEQIGRGDVKHAFNALNLGCPCGGSGHIFYVGCGDVYGTSTNADRRWLAPHGEVSSFTGEWHSRGSHFDGDPVDDFRDHGGNPDHDDFEHRITVAEDDLENPDPARYFVDAWYVAGSDVDIFNSMGYREVDPVFGGSTWSFDFVDGGLTNGSVLDAWIDPGSPPVGSLNTVLDTGRGRLQLAGAGTGVGTYRYEYVLMNWDFDPRVLTFSVPIPAGVTPTGVGFSDGDGDGANDWQATLSDGRLTWVAPEGATLEWADMMNFWFDADTAPTGGQATLVPLLIFTDGFESGDVATWATVGTARQFAVDTIVPAGL